MAKINTNINISTILTKIQHSRNIDKNGNVTFTGYDFGETNTTIESFIKFDPKVPKSQRSSIVSGAIFDAAKNKTISRAVLEKHLNVKENAYINRPLEKFYLLSSLSITRPSDLKRINVNGQVISFALNQPKKFNREGLNIDRLLLEKEHETRQFTKIRLSVHARCESGAFDVGYDQVDYLRGIWNWYLNAGQRMSSGLPNPVNVIIPGPIHTIHTGNGNPVSSVYWYEPRYPHCPKIKTISALKFTKLLSFTKKVKRAVSSSAYKNELIQILIRYSRALDTTDFESSFLRIWNIVEQLTNTVGASYDSTIRRVSFMFQEQDYHKVILEHLRLQRNSSVHRSEFSESAENTLFQVKYYAEKLLQFHLFNSYKFGSIQEAGDFLQTTTDGDSLRSQLEKTKAVLKYLGHAPKI